MKVFRMIVVLAIILFAGVFILNQPDSMISPKGFFTTLAALFFTSICVGFIWPDMGEPDAEDEEDGQE